MNDREKVIKGLECCMSEKTCHGHCPYNGECEDGGYFYSKAIEDAIALLKAQEPRVVNQRPCAVEIVRTLADDDYKKAENRAEGGGSLEELRPCPFCGGIAVIDTVTTAMEKEPRFRVRCTECWCQTNWDLWSDDEAAEAWNRRVNDETD